MGQAKQRQEKLGDRYGYPEIFILQIFSADASQTVRVPLPIKRRSGSLLTESDALALAGLIFAYYTMPTEGIWVAVKTAIAQYCRSSDVQPSLETIKPISAQLPTAFWGWVKATTVNELGDRALGHILEYRITETGEKRQRIFESVQGVGPQQTESQTRSFGTFQQQLMEANR